MWKNILLFLSLFKLLIYTSHLWFGLTGLAILTDCIKIEESKIMNTPPLEDYQNSVFLAPFGGGCPDFIQNKNSNDQNKMTTFSWWKEQFTTISGRILSGLVLGFANLCFVFASYDNVMPMWNKVKLLYTGMFLTLVTLVGLLFGIFLMNIFEQDSWPLEVQVLIILLNEVVTLVPLKRFCESLEHEAFADEQEKEEVTRGLKV